MPAIRCTSGNQPHCHRPDTELQDCILGQNVSLYFDEKTNIGFLLRIDIE